MKDKEKRKKGKYINEKEIIKNNKIYIMKETIIVGRNYEILNIVREYNPPLPYSFEDFK